MLHYLLIEWNPSPEIFPSLDWPVIGNIRWYGLLFALGFILSHYILQKVFKKEGVSLEKLDSLTVYIVIATIIGARLGHVFFYGPYFDEFDAEGRLLHEGYISNPVNIIKIWEGGLASHGGAIGILIAMYLFVKKHNLSYLWVLDRLAIVIPLAGTMIRLGNFMNSEIVGEITDVPWAIYFSRIDPVEVGRHPAQLYEAFSYFLIFVVTLFMYKKRGAETPKGFLIGWFMILVFGARFLIEFVKEEQVNFEEGMLLNMGQILSIPLVLTGIFLIYRSMMKPAG